MGIKFKSSTNQGKSLRFGKSNNGKRFSFAYGEFMPNPNYIFEPERINTQLYGGGGFVSENNWFLGNGAEYVGTTMAPDGSQNAVIYRSKALLNGANCYIAQGWESKWQIGRTITISVWAKLIDAAGYSQPLSNVMNIAVNGGIVGGRISVGTGEITTEWKKFSTTFQCQAGQTEYKSIFLFEGWRINQKVALWGAGLTY